MFVYTFHYLHFPLPSSNALSSMCNAKSIICSLFIIICLNTNHKLSRVGIILIPVFCCCFFFFSGILTGVFFQQGYSNSLFLKHNLQFQTVIASPNLSSGSAYVLSQKWCSESYVKSVNHLGIQRDEKWCMNVRLLSFCGHPNLYSRNSKCSKVEGGWKVWRAVHNIKMTSVR